MFIRERIVLKKIEKFCSNCMYGITVSINDDILCRKKGIVSSNYCCSKHKFNYKIEIFKPKCIDCMNFFLEDETKDCSMGICRLFTVRQYDGRQKNACSKYIAK